MIFADTDVVFEKAATPKIPEASPAATSASSDDNETNITEHVDGTTISPAATSASSDDNETNITEHVDGTTISPAVDVNQEHPPSPEEHEETDHSQLPVLASDDLRDCESSESRLDISQSNEQKAESESAITDESSTDELDFIPQEEAEPRTTLSKQRVVTFEDMSKRHACRGPLITSDQLIETGEDLSKIIFCRHFTSSVKQGGPEQERGYGEVTVTGLTKGLKHAQKLYNQQDVLPLDLVFFEKAVRHAARLSRSFVSIKNI